MRLGGAGRDRTDDLKLAKLALSQLSYAPIQGRSDQDQPDQGRNGHPALEPGSRSVVGRAGFEPATSRLSSARSNQLSYQPKA